jgi:tetratricopeptide (TPR) repeat protein
MAPGDVAVRSNIPSSLPSGARQCASPAAAVKHRRRRLLRLPGWPKIAATMSQEKPAPMNRKQRRAARTQRPKDAGLTAAIGHHQAGRLDEAAALYRRILDEAPADADALHLLGLTHHQRGDHDAAVALIEQAIAANGGAALYHANLGAALRALGRSIDAVAAYGRALALDPDDGETRRSLALALVAAGDLDGAHHHFERALALEPGSAVAHVNLGKLLAMRGDAPAALARFRHAVALDGGNDEAQYQLGIALAAAGDTAAAAVALGRAVEARPDDPQALDALGLALKALGRLDQAIAVFERAIAAAPDRPEARNDLGNTLKLLGRYEAALAAYDAALECDPGYAMARTNRALMRLALGRLEDGWRDYHARLNGQGVRAMEKLPAALGGQRIVVRKEQGLGDELFFLRFVALVAQRGARIAYEADPKIAGVLAGLGFIDRLIAPGDAVDDADMTVAIGDLPFALDIADPADLPPPVRLRVGAAPAAAIAARLAGATPPLIGLTWRAGLQGRNRLFKTAPLAGLAAGLRGLPGTVVALQRQPGAGELAELAAAAGRAVLDMTDLNEDLATMLALLDRLQDYVCVSNTNTHLRAGLGHACRVLVPHPPDYRWMTAGAQTPWFPGVTVYRQSVDGDWSAALAALAGDLAAAHSA